MSAKVKKGSAVLVREIQNGPVVVNLHGTVLRARRDGTVDVEVRRPGSTQPTTLESVQPYKPKNGGAVGDIGQGWILKEPEKPKAAKKPDPEPDAEPEPDPDPDPDEGDGDEDEDDELDPDAEEDDGDEDDEFDPDAEEDDGDEDEKPKGEDAKTS